MNMNFMLVGNPGVGKSTMLNSMMGDLFFHSGYSPGSGLTYQLDKKSVNGNHFFDTPGLADMKKREQAAVAIEEALKLNGTYKIIFVICLEAGRVSPQDVATIKCVLTACKVISNRYGVIINKVPAGGLPKVRESLQEICATLFLDDTMPPTAFVHVNPKDPDLDDEDDVFAELTDELLQFIMSVPTIEIKPSDVEKIDIRDYEQIAAQMEATIDALKADKELLQKKMDSQAEQFQNQINTLKKEQAEAVARMEADNKKEQERLDAEVKKQKEEQTRLQNDMEKKQKEHEQKLKEHQQKQEADRKEYEQRVREREERLRKDAADQQEAAQKGQEALIAQMKEQQESREKAEREREEERERDAREARERDDRAMQMMNAQIAQMQRSADEADQRARSAEQAAMQFRQQPPQPQIVPVPAPGCILQ